MPNLSLSFVNFFKEKRGRKIVSISRIENFQPSHHSDFDDNKTYGIRWAHLPVAGSFSTEGVYEAKIICLGVDLNDLQHEAKIKGVTIPQTALQEFDANNGNGEESSKKPKQTPPKSSRGRRLKTSASLQSSEDCQAPPDPRMRKKRKSSIEDLTREKRKMKSLDSYNNYPLFTPDEPKAQSPEASKAFGGSTSCPKVPIEKAGVAKSSLGSLVIPQQRVLVDSSTDEETDGLHGETPGDMDKDVKTVNSCDSFLSPPLSVSNLKDKVKNSLMSQKSVKPSNVKPTSHAAPTHPETASTKNESKEDPPSNSDKHQRDLASEIKSDIKKSVPPGPSLPIYERTSSKYASSSTSNTISSNDDVSSSDAEKDLYYNKMRKLEVQLRSEQGKTKRFEEEMETQKALINELKAEVSRISKVNVDLSEKLLALLSSNTAEPKAAMKKKDKDSVQKALFVSPRKDVMEVDLDSEPTLPKLSPRKLSKVSTPPFKKGRKSDKVKESPEASLGQGMLLDSEPSLPDLSPKKLDKVTTPLKKARKADKLKEAPEGNLSQEASKVSTNEELYQMILLALESKAPLQSDGNGKVHLGNGVWLSEKAWEHKIRKATVSPSIAIRDAMSKIYSLEEMAERSLEGATPVKASGGQKIKKKKNDSAEERSNISTISG